jgi:DNA polymerase II small subunit
MKNIIKSFSEHGTLVQPETLDYIMSKKNPYEFASFLTKNMKEYPLVLTLDTVKNLEEETKKTEITKPIKSTFKIKNYQTKMLTTLYSGEFNPEKSPENEIEYDELDKEDTIEITEEKTSVSIPSVINLKKVKGWKPLARDYEPEIEIFKDVTGKSLCEGTTTDFNRLFMNRFNSLKKILRSQRRELANSLPVNRIRNSGVTDIQVTGIVKDVRNTSNGHRLIELEDETGIVICIALKNNREILHLANEVVLDEIIGIRGSLSKNGDLLVIKSIIYPDISIQNQHHKSQVPVYAAFLSDIHVGSKQFMEKEWQGFLKWINGEVGNTRQRDVAGKIKYLVIPGDVVDGIGIYPNQEDELSIPDVYRQYEALAEQLSLIPDHITLIMQPGNHDAVRPAEPQPTFEREIQDLFTSMDIRFIGNPCYFSLHEVEVLSYHGQSLLDFATNIQHLKYNDPVETMKVMLKKHHLAPTYGGYTPLAPEHLDYMVIDKIPDIFVTGHVHLAQISEYRGVKLINASSWQSQTTYQKMLNFIPDSAKLPIVDLKSGNVTMMDFNNGK